MKKFMYLLISMFFVSAYSYADQPTTHGMLIFGDQVTYASHLPMFHAPHDYQLIMKLSMVSASRADTIGYYQQAKQDGLTLFTLLPEVLDLNELIDGSKTSFNAHLFSGHFERNGENLGLVKVTVEKIVYSNKLEPIQELNPYHKYLMFGENGEYFAAHVIEEKPSFDAILKITKPVKEINLGCYRRACPELAYQDLPLPAYAYNHKGNNNSFNLPVIGTQLSDSATIQTEIKDIIYLETAELEH